MTPYFKRLLIRAARAPGRNLKAASPQLESGPQKPAKRSSVYHFLHPKIAYAESCRWDVFSSYSKLVKVHFSHAFSRFSNCCYARSAHLPCLPARRDVRQLGSLLANRERYRIRSRRSCAVCGSRVFVCALHLQIRGAWFCCKECFRSLRPEVLLVHGI